MDIEKLDPKKIKENFEHPDAKKDQLVSFVKSAIRLVGYTLLLVNLEVAVGVLILSEVIGIIEELV